jgi:hypothetical protein
MKLFEDGKLKSVRDMDDDELHNVVAMLRDLRAKALTGATRSIKQRAQKDATIKPKRIPKMMDMSKVAGLLSPEEAKLFEEMIKKEA